MGSMLYRPDMDDVRARLTAWWNGDDIGRPAMLLTVPRDEPHEHIPAMPEPEGWCTHYSTGDFAYRVSLSEQGCLQTDYLAEAVPCTAPDLGANCLALYLGCRGVEMPGTVWFEPCIDPGDPKSARFEYDPDNFYWQFTQRLCDEQRRVGRGKFLWQFPDLIEGLDTLAAMRGTEVLLADLIERPEWVTESLAQITQLYFRYYDPLYDWMRDEVGGSIFWCWAPGRMAKFQCDFCAMISPEMFGQFMAPVLDEMCRRVSYCMYHWDGPGAIQHQNHLLSIEALDMIQWTPGAGAEEPDHPRWWPMHHKTLDAGKKLFITCSGLDSLRALRREFGQKLNQCLLSIGAETGQQADRILAAAEN